MRTQERPRNYERSDAQVAEDVSAWLRGRLPDAWVTTPPTVTVDRDEILIVLGLTPPDTSGQDEAGVAAAETGRISRFREETREERMQLAREAEHRYGRRVAWGASAGGTTLLFTTLSVPVMTRLRQPERQGVGTPGGARGARSPRGGPGRGGR